jgi:hypothetical protein
MKRKIALIAAAMTTFTVIILASVIYGFRVNAEEQAAASALSEPQQVGDLIQSVPLSIQRLSPEQAAASASAYLEGTDPFSVQLADYNGVQPYMVTFPDGAVVYVSTWGKLLAYTAAPNPTQVTQVTAVINNRHSGREEKGGGGRGGEDSGQHESEHESGGDD